MVKYIFFIYSIEGGVCYVVMCLSEGGGKMIKIIGGGAQWGAFGFVVVKCSCKV